MDIDNIQKKLLNLERQYNTYQISQQEAIVKAKILIKEYNKLAKDLGIKYKMQPKLTSLRKFSFGK